MNSVWRIGLCLAVLGLVAAGAKYADPSWFCDPGPEGLPLSEVQDYLQRQVERGEALDSLLEKQKRQREARAELVFELAAGRLTLVEAAARIRDLYGSTPSFWEGLRMAEKGNTDEERLCRHAIGWVESMLADRPCEASAVAARLEAELGDHLARHGKVILPR